MIERFFKFLLGYERAVFFLVVLLFSSFFFTYHYFVSGDGAAHLYNANLLVEFLKGDNPFLSSYYEINSFPVPNWTGHLILAFLNLFLSIENVEKVFLLFYFFAFAYSFKYLVSSFNKEVGLFSLLILPFGINLFVHAGFYNFCLASVFLFLIIGFFVRRNDKMNLKSGFILTLLFVLLYFSHVTVALFVIFFLFLYIFWLVLISVDVTWREKIFKGLRQALVLGLICLPTLVLIMFYFNYHVGEANYEFIKLPDLLLMLGNISSLVGQGTGEHVYTHIYLIVFVFLICFGLSRSHWKRATGFKFIKEDVFVFGALILLIFYFILPDSDGKGGYISLRILYLFYLLVLIRIVVHDYPKWLKNDALIVVLLTFYFHLQLKQGGQRELSIYAKKTAEAGTLIEPNSVVLPINYAKRGHVLHLANYLGAKKPLVILENYEATMFYFPLKWKSNAPVPYTISLAPDFVNREYFQKFHQMRIKPDYLFFYGLDEINPTESSSKAAMVDGLSGYSLIHQSDFCELYELEN